jgi:hypothetical protein
MKKRKRREKETITRRHRNDAYSKAKRFEINNKSLETSLKKVILYEWSICCNMGD